MSRTLELTDFTSTPVDIKTFIEDPQYLGEFAKDIYPYWKEKLQEVYTNSPIYGPISPYMEVLLEGAFGTGRTFASLVGFLYDIYLFTLIRNPHEKYGLMPTISINFYVANDDVANTHICDAILDIIDNSPYFKSLMLPGKGEELAEEMFPNRIGIVHVGSKRPHRSYLGRSIAGVLFEDYEMEGMTEKDKDFVDGLRRRIITRYMSSEGIVPCRMWIVSSAGMPDTSIVRHFHEYGPRITFAPSVWDVQAFKGIYSGETFSVFKGNDTEKPFILEDGKVYEDYLHGNVIHMPVEYKPDFEKDIYTALRELAGIAVSAPLDKVNVPTLTVVTNDLKFKLITLYALGMIMAFLLGYYCGIN